MFGPQPFLRHLKTNCLLSGGHAVIDPSSVNKKDNFHGMDFVHLIPEANMTVIPNKCQHQCHRAVNNNLNKHPELYLKDVSLSAMIPMKRNVYPNR